MSASDFSLPERLEACLISVCKEQNVPERRMDELRLLLLTPEPQWPACCRASCSPCVNEQTAIARLVKIRYAADGGSDGSDA